MLAFGIEITTDLLADAAVTTPKIADAAVTNAKMAGMAQALVKGRAAGGGTGVPQDLTATQVKAILAYAASEVSYNNVSSGLIATTVQAAIDELDTALDALGNGMVFKGTFNAGGGAGPVNFPGAGAAQAGWFYPVINAAGGGTTLGSSNPIVVHTGDQIVAAVDNASATNGADWVLIDSTDSVTSVAGKTGNVTLVSGDISGVATDRLLGRDTAGTGAAEELTVGGGIEFTGSVGIQRSALTGDVTATAGSNSTTIAANAVSNGKLATMAQGTIKGRASGAGTGDPVDLTGAQVKAIIGALQTADIGDDQVTFAKLQNIATDSLIGRDTAGTGDPETITLGTGLEFTGSSSIQRSALTGDVTSPAGSNATTIATSAVTNAKMADMVQATVKGRASGAGTGAPVDLTGTQVKAIIGALVTADIADAQITFAKLQNIATDSLIGRDTAGTGVPESITLATSLEFSGSGTIQRSALTGDITSPAGSNATTLVQASSAFAFTGDISPTQITANQNDYNPTGLATASVLRLNSDALRAITGLAGGADGRILYVHNVGAQNLRLDDESANSTAANRFALNSNQLLLPDDVVVLMYDSTSLRWRQCGNPNLTLNGDVSGSGVGTMSVTIANSAVTYAKMQNVSAASRVLGRGSSAGAGVVQELTLGSSLVMSTNAIVRAALTGDVTASQDGNATTIAANAVTNTQIRDSGALSVIGRSANSTGDPADISATAATDSVLRESGSTIGFGTIATAGIANDAVTDAKIRNSGALSVIGRSANSSGDPADISASAASGAVLRESGSTIGFGTIATAGIAANAATNAKLAQMAQSTIKGAVAGGGTTDPVDLTTTQVRAIVTDAEWNFGAHTVGQALTSNSLSAGAATIDWRNSNKQTITFNANGTLTFTAPSQPSSLVLQIKQDATGSRVITWPSSSVIKWLRGTVPTLTSTANAVDVYTFFYDGSLYYGAPMQNFS